MVDASFPEIASGISVAVKTMAANPYVSRPVIQPILTPALTSSGVPVFRQYRNTAKNPAADQFKIGTRKNNAVAPTAAISAIRTAIGLAKFRGKGAGFGYTGAGGRETASGAGFAA